MRQDTPAGNLFSAIHHSSSHVHNKRLNTFAILVQMISPQPSFADSIKPAPEQSLCHWPTAPQVAQVVSKSCDALKPDQELATVPATRFAL